MRMLSSDRSDIDIEFILKKICCGLNANSEIILKMIILSVNGDFPTILLVNYRNLCCFISLIQLLQRKFNNAKKKTRQ